MPSIVSTIDLEKRLLAAICDQMREKSTQRAKEKPGLRVFLTGADWERLSHGKNQWKDLRAILATNGLEAILRCEPDRHWIRGHIDGIGDPHCPQADAEKDHRAALSSYFNSDSLDVDPVMITDVIMEIEEQLLFSGDYIHDGMKLMEVLSYS